MMAGFTWENMIRNAGDEALLNGTGAFRSTHFCVCVGDRLQMFLPGKNKEV